MAQAKTLTLYGSYSEADFANALGIVGEPATLETAGAALRALDTPTDLIWHNFHGATVGAHDSDAMAAWLRALAHECANLRLVFFDEEGEGQ